MKFDELISIELACGEHKVRERRHYGRVVATDDAKYRFDEGLPWLVLSGPDGLSNQATVQALRDALERG
jgi:hypothetical protein